MDKKETPTIKADSPQTSGVNIETPATSEQPYYLKQANEWYKKTPEASSVPGARSYVPAPAPAPAPTQALTQAPIPAPAPAPAVGGVAVPSFKVPTTEAGATGQMQTSQDYQEKMLGGISAATEALALKPQYKQAVEKQYGLAGKEQLVRDIDDRLNKLLISEQAQMDSVEGKGDTESFVVGAQQQIAKTFARRRLGVAMEKTAATGDLESTRKAIDDVIDTEFEPIKTKIDNAKYLIDINEKNFTKAEKVQAQKTKERLDREERAYQAAREEKRGVRDIALEAMKQGVGLSDIGTILNSRNTDDAIKSMAKLTSATGDVPFASTIQTAALAEPSATGKNMALKQMKTYAITGNNKALLTQMKNSGRNAIPATIRDNVVGADANVEYGKDMLRVLEKYKANGGDMGYLKGNTDKIASKIGQLKVDTRFKEIAVEMETAFNQYVNNITGAAMTAGEINRYRRVMPSETGTFELNDAVIRGMVNANEKLADRYYTGALGEGYINLKQNVEAEDSYGKEYDAAISSKQVAGIPSVTETDMSVFNRVTGGMYNK